MEFKRGDFVRYKNPEMGSRIMIIKAYPSKIFDSEDYVDVLSSSYGYMMTHSVERVEDLEKIHLVCKCPKENNNAINKVIKSVSILINENIEIPLKDAQLETESNKIYSEKYKRRYE